MKKIVLIVFLVSISCIISREDHKRRNALYFGQETPGNSPKVFHSPMKMDGFRRHGFPAFSPDGREVYWPVIPPRIMFMKFQNGAWTSPTVAPFSERNSQAPNFSPDGRRLYYQVSRKDGLGSLDIWYVERTASGWGEPQNIGPPVNTEKLESQPSLTEDGTLYFTGTRKGTMWNRGLYRAEFKNGRYSEPELLGDSINTKYLEIYPFVAQDESYLLFCSTRPTMDEKNQRIFVSFRSKSGKWSEPVNLNKKINFDHTSSFPYVSPDGKYLFFNAKGDLYWVDAGVIHQIKP
jgi:Tol biopolymer transport system component